MRSLVVLGRRPVPGRVKTRLAAEVGSVAAAEIYDHLLRHTLDVALDVGVPVVLSLAEPASDDWRPPRGVAVENQPRGDLGHRMARTFGRRFEEGCGEVVLIGSDCPEVTTGRLAGAFAMLETHAVVLGPALDGGYWLVGQRRPGQDMFGGVPWSSRRTLQATRQQLRTRGVGWAEIDMLTDVDTADDLRRAARDGRLEGSLSSSLTPYLSGLQRRT